MYQNARCQNVSTHFTFKNPAIVTQGAAWFTTVLLTGRQSPATGIFVHSSRQYCSSSFKLDGIHWCIAIFKLYHRFSIDLRSGLWQGHSKTFKYFPLNHLSVALAVCLGSLSCWKVNLHHSLNSLEEWNRFPSRISLYLVQSFIPSILTSFPNHCRWKTSPQHDAATIIPQCGGEIPGEMRGVGFVGFAFSLMAKIAQF